MCRSIKTLFNFAPPATDEEIRAASLQFVRKLSGFTAPSHANQVAFDRAIADVYKVARKMIDSMTTTAPPRDRVVEAAKAKERAAIRFGTKPAKTVSRRGSSGRDRSSSGTRKRPSS